MQGLREALDDALQRHPECAAEGQRLHALLAGFDLDGFVEQLTSTLRNAPAVVEMPEVSP